MRIFALLTQGTVFLSISIYEAEAKLEYVPDSQLIHALSEVAPVVELAFSFFADVRHAANDVAEGVELYRLASQFMDRPPALAGHPKRKCLPHSLRRDLSLLPSSLPPPPLPLKAQILYLLQRRFSL